MKSRIVIVLVILFLLLLPLLLLFITNNKKIAQSISLFQSKLKPSVAAQYSVKSVVPDATVQVVNTQYLDYAAGKLKLFNNLSVVDPAVYHRKKNISIPLHHISCSYRAGRQSGKPNRHYCSGWRE